MLAFVQLWKSLAVTILQMPFRRGLASDCRRGRRYVAPFLVNRDFAAWNHVGTENNFTPYENHATFNNFLGMDLLCPHAKIPVEKFPPDDNFTLSGANLKPRCHLQLLLILFLGYFLLNLKIIGIFMPLSEFCRQTVRISFPRSGIPVEKFPTMI